MGGEENGGSPAEIALNAEGTGSSTQVPNGRFSAGFPTQAYRWFPPAISPVLDDISSATTVTTLFPGDTVRIPVRLSVGTLGAPGEPTEGTISVRYEFRTRFPVPEPSAALSLPLGALTLAGLASLRG